MPMPVENPEFNLAPPNTKATIRPIPSWRGSKRLKAPWFAMLLSGVVAGIFLKSIPAMGQSGAADLCVSVRGLCAPHHLKTLEGFRMAITPGQWDQLLASRELLELAPALRGASGTVTEAIRGDLAGQILGGMDTAGRRSADPSQFGPRGHREHEMPPGEGVLPKSNRVSGSAGDISDTLRSNSRTIPSNRSWSSLGGNLPGNNAQPNKKEGTDVSVPNTEGGVTRVTSANGQTKIVETRSDSRGGSTLIVTVVREDGSTSVSMAMIDPYDPQHEWLFMSHRDGASGLFEYKAYETTDSGSTWSPLARGRDVNPIPRDFRRNVDPDGIGRSSYPPVCAIANPDCGRPLLLSYHRQKPGVLGRPDDVTGDPVPRLRTDRFGTVVNPGLEPRGGHGVGSPGRSQRSFDGGKLVNPANERTGEGNPPSP